MDAETTVKSNERKTRISQHSVEALVPLLPKKMKLSVYREGNAVVEAAEAVSQSGKIMLADGDSFILYGHLYSTMIMYSL